MRLFAPQTILFALLMLISQVSISQAASACHEQEIIGQETSANTWFSARRNARAKWVSKVSGVVGRRWNNWSFADKRGYMCWEKGAQKVCKAAATPCNGRMKSVSVFPQNNKNDGNQNSRKNRYGSDRERGRDADRKQARRNDKDDFKRRDFNSRVKETRNGQSASESGYFTQTLLDNDRVKKTCNGRSTRIAGKLVYDLAKAKRSASTLWSEYVDITKGEQWSRWELAKRREIKCVPDGLRVKCEVSAIACKSLDAKELRHVKRSGKSGNRIALPMKRPDLNSFAFDETVSRDPGEYGDGNSDDTDTKIELPTKRDGFSLPWVSKPPASRPEPEDGEEGPFGENSIAKEFDISGLQKNDFGSGRNGSLRSKKKFNQQGSLTPALPVARPTDQKTARNREGGNSNEYSYQEDYQYKQLKNSTFSGLTLPQQRPSRARRSQRDKHKRFSQNFNTDNEGETEEEDSFGGGRTRPSRQKPRRDKNRVRQQKNWNTDPEGEDKKGFDRIRNGQDRADVRSNRKLRGRLRKEKNKSNNWNFDTDTDTDSEKRGRENRNNARRRRGVQGRNIDINVSRPDAWKRKNKGRKGSKTKRNNRRNKKVQQEWNLDRALEAQNNEDFDPRAQGSREKRGREKRGRNPVYKRADKRRRKPRREYREKSKVIGGWTADDEGENRSVTRRSGERKGRSITRRSKFKGRIFGSLSTKDSKINYTSNSGVMTRSNTFYGCKEEEVASWGTAQPTKPQARQAAIKSWQKVIYNKLGKNWSDWMKAGSSRVQCGTQNGMKKCVAIGNPCGEVALQKADDFVSTARCRIYALKFRGDSNADLAQAKQNAMNVWEKKIEKKYGAKWSDWFRSMEHRISCKKRRGKMRCQASAIPCSL